MAKGKQVGKAKKANQAKEGRLAAQRQRARAPVSEGAVVRHVNPSVRHTHRGVVVRNSEYLMDLEATVAASSEFSPVELNPGLQATFPWLSTVAQAYEYYRVNHLTVRYEPSCSTASGGSISMAVDYDSYDPNPITKQQLLAMEGSVRSPLWRGCSMTLSTAKANTPGNRKYNRYGTVSGDLRLYDVGRLVVLLQAAAAVRAGELWLDYDIEFMTPQMRPTIESLVNAQQYVFTGGVTNPVGTTNSVLPGLLDGLRVVWKPATLSIIEWFCNSNSPHTITWESFSNTAGFLNIFSNQGDITHFYNTTPSVSTPGGGGMVLLEPMRDQYAGQLPNPTPLKFNATTGELGDEANYGNAQFSMDTTGMTALSGLRLVFALATLYKNNNLAGRVLIARNRQSGGRIFLAPRPDGRFPKYRITGAVAESTLFEIVTDPSTLPQ